MKNEGDHMNDESTEKSCDFCKGHYDGDTLFDGTDWDTGVGFEFIRNIHFCPLCGKQLRKLGYLN